MADKKLNEVTKVTDMAYVPVILSDGSVGQIAKADLATVVAGIIRQNMIATFTSVDSLDTLNNGLTNSSKLIIPFATTYINNVTGATDNHIIGFAFSVDQASEYQIAYGIISKKWYQRNKSYSSSTWSSWTVVS